GRVNLHATAAGLLLLDPEKLAAANAVSEAVGIATLAPMSPVAAGALVATVKIIPFAVAETVVTAVARTEACLSLAPFRAGICAALLPTLLGEASDKQLAKTETVTRDRLEGMGIALEPLAPVPHAVAPLAEALRRAGRWPLLLVAGATATADPEDVIPAAIRAAGGAVLRTGMPVDPGNLLVLGQLGATTVIGLPGCAKSPKRNGLDLVLERFAAGLSISSAEVARMGVGGLLEDSGRPVPWAWSG
ncbi:MAG: molybdopterin biosynthesis protein, partial [Sphingomonadaceae bacterium]